MNGHQPLIASSMWRRALRSRWSGGPLTRCQGVGPALNTSAGIDAYILSDRGTWLNFHNRGNLTIVVEGDKRLFNQYGVMLVNPEKHPNVKKELGQQFIDWLVSPVGQKAIADYKINGEQLFYPNASDPSA